MPDAHKNFAYSAVATAPSPADTGTSLIVTAGQGALFPATPFNATVWPTAAQPLAANAEIVRVTTIAGDTLTITRAQEGSSARSIVVGDQIAATITEKTLADIEAHAPLTISVHGFDPSGDAPAQTHGNTRHSDTFVTQGEIDTSIGTHAGVAASVHGFDASGNAPPQSHSHAQSDVTGLPTAVVDIKNVMATGLLKGCHLSLNADTSKFDLSAGYGVVVDNSDPSNPVKTVVNFSGATGIATSYIATCDETQVHLDVNGNVVQVDYYMSYAQRRSLIHIGGVGHPDRATNTYVLDEPTPTKDVYQQLYDVGYAFGAFNISGNTYSANGANLKLNRTGGEEYDVGANWVYSEISPNVLISAAATPTTLYYGYTDAGGNWLYSDELTDIDPTQYDTLNGLATVPANKWTIQTITFYGNGEWTDVQYGQATYVSMAEAEAAIPQGFQLDPFLEFDVFRCWLIVRQDCTNLSDPSKAKFINAGRFGLLSATGGGISGEANVGANVGTAGVGWYDGKTDITLNFKNIEAASSKLSVADYPTNKTVRVDVAEANIVHNNISGGTATVSVHGFDASGNAPAQTHGNIRHSIPYLPEAAFSGLSKLTVGTVPPGSPAVNDLWVDTN